MKNLPKNLNLCKQNMYDMYYKNNWEIKWLKNKKKIKLTQNEFLLFQKNKYLFELYNYYFYPSKIIFII